MPLFIIVPTRFLLYHVVDINDASLKLVKGFSTKGAAIKWINKEGEPDVDYLITACYTKNRRRKS